MQKHFGRMPWKFWNKGKVLQEGRQACAYLSTHSLQIIKNIVPFYTFRVLPNIISLLPAFGGQAWEQNTSAVWESHVRFAQNSNFSINTWFLCINQKVLTEDTFIVAVRLLHLLVFVFVFVYFCVIYLFCHLKKFYQRASFTCWCPLTGKPLFPMITWQVERLQHVILTLKLYSSPGLASWQ